MSLCRCVVVSLCRCVVVSLCLCVMTVDVMRCWGILTLMFFTFCGCVCVCVCVIGVLWVFSVTIVYFVFVRDCVFVRAWYVFFF